MKKLIYLEGLRGIAALVVVISHFVQVFYPALLENNKQLYHNNFEGTISELPLNLFYNGSFAVCIFFVLSGYVLSLNYFKTENLEVIYSGASKRYFRLVIPVFFSLVLAYILLRINAFSFDEIRGLTKSTLNNFFILQHDLIGIIKLALIDTFKGAVFYNTVLWTMQYELKGSLIVFILLPLLVKIRKELIIYMVYLLLGIVISKFLDIYYSAFILGLLLCSIQKNCKWLRGILSYKFTKWFILLIGLFFGSYPYVETSNTIYSFLNILIAGENASPFYHILGAFLLLLVLINSKAMQKMFNYSIFEFLGKISFSLYLTHLLILCTISTSLFKQLYNLGASYNISFILTFMISIILMVSVSYLVYKYVDTTAIRLSKYLYKFVFKPIYFDFFNNAKEKEDKNIST